MKKSMRFVLALCATLAAQAAVPCFTVKLRVDLSGVATNEALYEVGCVRLALRIAGQDKNLLSYDNRQGNYLNFPTPDGTYRHVRGRQGGRPARSRAPRQQFPHFKSAGVHVGLSCPAHAILGQEAQRHHL